MGAAFILPAIGTAMNYFNQRAANSRYNTAEQGAIQNQSAFRNQANTDVLKQINNIATSNPNAAANSEAGSFVNTLRNNVGGATGTTSKSPTNFGAPTSALGPTPGANKRYASDTAAANNEVQSYGNTNANELSAVDTAVNQRKNEALQMQTLGANLNVLNARSALQAFTDQLRAKAAGTVNPWVGATAQAIGGTGNFFANKAGSTPQIPLGSGSANNGADYAGAFTGD
jgi:hypothetical protein